MASVPEFQKRLLPERRSRTQRVPSYVASPLPAMEDVTPNPNYSHGFMTVGQSWKTIQLFPQEIRESYAQQIQGQPFGAKNAKWFIWSSPNEYTDQYVTYAPISGRILKPCWKNLANHVICATLPFKSDPDWFIWLCKVKKRIEKLDGDFDNVEIIKIRFNQIHEFHGIAHLIHELVLRQWDNLSDDLRSYLSNYPRFSNDVMMHYMGLMPRKTLLLLRDGTMVMFQALSHRQFCWNTPVENIKKIGVIEVHHEEQVQDEKGQVDSDEWAHVAWYGHGHSWLQDLFFKRSELMEKRRLPWKMRCASLAEIRQVANMMQFQFYFNIEGNKYMMYLILSHTLN